MTLHNERILLVDDEQSVLDGLCRQHRKHYTLTQACGPEAGLHAIKTDGPFSVVVTDFKMPVMNGAAFLAAARELDPDIIPVLLTGQADLQTAVDAINRGHIFRFLSKPCEPELFRGCLEAALDQHRLKHLERDMLEKTVNGSIEVLVEVLALSNPAAFGRAKRVRTLVKHIVNHLKLRDAWKYETAALLSQIGFIAIPDDLLYRIISGDSLQSDEISIFDRHPGVARDLLKKIPRLQDVAEIVYHQKTPKTPSSDKAIALGGRVLAAALEFDELLGLGATPKDAIKALASSKPNHDRKVLVALMSAKTTDFSCDFQRVPVKRLLVGMVVGEEIRNRLGNLILSKGHEITQGSLERIQNYAELNNLEKSVFRIMSPPSGPEAASQNPAA
ncbi:MAG: response regulator RpfG family c-di-GMP phosphodiesterase [Planctomycetota bacterium]|jgi:response regulator RpfG family c-di-GMP phosphodiesterase